MSSIFFICIFEGKGEFLKIQKDPHVLVKTRGNALPKCVCVCVYVLD